MVTIFSPATHRLVTASKTFWEMAAALRYLVRVSGLFRVWSDERSSQRTRSTATWVCGCTECRRYPTNSGVKTSHHHQDSGGVCSYRSPQSPSCLPCLRCDGRRGWNAGEFVNRARVGGVVCGLCCVVLGMESIRSARVWKLLCGLCSSFFACYVGPNPLRIFPAWPAELNLLGAINLPEPYMIHTYTYPH